MLVGMCIYSRNQCTDGIFRPISDGNHVGCTNLHFGFLFCSLVSIFYLICISFDIFKFFFLFCYMYFLESGLQSSVRQSGE